MIKRRQIVLIMCGFVASIGLALWPGCWLPPAYANVTLLSFTAASLPEQTKILVKWETATELDTSGFFVTRRDSFAGTFTRVSDFVIADGSTVVGAQYAFTDTIPALNQTYYYRLEVINTNQTIDYHGPISVTVGPAHTLTPTPTATPTMQSTTEAVDPTLPSNSRIVATPPAATGDTITPQPTASSSLPRPVAIAATPAPGRGENYSQSPALVVNSVPADPNLSVLATPVPPPTAYVAQAPVPTFVPTAAAPAAVEPVVIATQSPVTGSSANSSNSVTMILIAAAILFLGIALIILRQARQ